MNNQEILNTLSALECELYYRIDDGAETDPKMISAVNNVRSLLVKCLEEWHAATGLTIE